MFLLDLHQERSLDAGGFGLVSNLMAIKTVTDELVTDQHDPLSQVFGAVFVNPGSHGVRGRSGGREVTRTATVDAGGVVSVALMDDPPPAASTAIPVVSTLGPAASSAPVVSSRPTKKKPLRPCSRSGIP